MLSSLPVGTFHTVSKPGHTTMRVLLDEVNRVTGGRAELVWVDPDAVEAAGVAARTQLPIWALATAWISRAGGPYPGYFTAPQVQAESLIDLAGLLRP